VNAALESAGFRRVYYSLLVSELLETFQLRLTHLFGVFAPYELKACELNVPDLNPISHTTGFQRCVLVESSPRLISAAPDYIGDPHASQCRFLCTGLQDFEPASGSFDLIWIQWCIGYLNDVDYIPFLRKMGRSLRKGGIICLKDNTCTDEAFVVDTDDSSLTRSLPYHLALAEKAGLRVLLQSKQEDFPDDIFQVPMVAFEVTPHDDS